MPDMMMPQVSQAQAPVKAAKGPEKSPVPAEESSSNQDFSGVLRTRMAPAEEAAGDGAQAPETGLPGSEAEMTAAADGKALPPTGTLAETILAALQPDPETDSAEVAVPTEAIPAAAGLLLPELTAQVDRKFSQEVQTPLRADLQPARILAWLNGAAGDELPESAQTAVAQAVRTVLMDASDGTTEFSLARFGAEVRALATSQARPAGLENVLERLTSVTQPSSATTPAVVATSVSPQEAAARPAQPFATVEVPFRQPGWDQALSERVVWLVNQKFQGAEIKLNPPQLGPIEVRIHMHQDQAQVSFTSQHASVREALEAALPRLREMFSANGLGLGDVNVSQHSFAEQQRQMPGSPGEGKFRAARDAGEDAEGVVSMEQRVSHAGDLRTSAIDLFA